MKKKITLQKLPGKGLLLAFACILSIAGIKAQQTFQTRDVIPGYVGWNGNPDTLTVYIDDSFSASEKDSVRVAIQRWNAAGCKPVLKEVSSKPANVTVQEGDPGPGNAGVYRWRTNAAGKVTGGTITIRNNPNPGLVETATHELGHALGLDDTKAETNPTDVMRGAGASNGSNGNLSQHDSTELRAAIRSITPISNPADKKKQAFFPNKAILPGQTAMIMFDLGADYPPTTEIYVASVGDPLLMVHEYMFEANMLMVQVETEPTHGSGKFYLDIMLYPPPPIPPVEFLGFHYVHLNPVDPLDFECFPEIIQTTDGAVMVNWLGNHDYPFPGSLNATLMIGDTFYKTQGNFFIEGLPPGVHTLLLFVNDYQINSTICAATVIIEPDELPEFFGLRVGDWLIAEPWHQWIDGRPGATTQLQLHVHDPGNLIQQVIFEHNIDHMGWVPFFIDVDGEECTASPHVNCSETADGWSGYFSVPVLETSVMAQFRAIAQLFDGTVFTVDSFFDIFVDISPPSAVEINVQDFQIFPDSFFDLMILPAGANIDSIRVEVVAKKNEFAKGIDTLSQRRSWRSGYEEGGDNHCVPTAAAACLKYFADSASDQSIMGGLTPQQLVDSLAKLARTNVGIWGTYYSNMAAALRAWIEDNGNNYTVRGPLPYNWRTMRNELERSQDVLQGIHWPNGSGHMMTFNSIVNKPLDNGKIKVDFMDPWSGKIEYGELDTITGQMTRYTDSLYSGRLDWTIIVCPKEPTPLSPGGNKKQGAMPPPIQISLPDEGLYWIRIEILDSDGNKARKDIIAERIFTEFHQNGIVFAGENFCLDGKDLITTGGGDEVFVVEPNAHATIAARHRVTLADGTHFMSGSTSNILIANEACNIATESFPASRNVGLLPEEANTSDQATIFKVFPNPTTGWFTIHAPDTKNDVPVTVEVFNNLDEKLAMRQIPANQSYQFNLSDRPAGIYLLRLTQGGYIEFTKVIKM